MHATSSSEKTSAQQSPVYVTVRPPPESRREDLKKRCFPWEDAIECDAPMSELFERRVARTETHDQAKLAKTITPNIEPTTGDGQNGSNGHALKSSPRLPGEGEELSSPRLARARKSVPAPAARNSRPVVLVDLKPPAETEIPLAEIPAATPEVEFPLVVPPELLTPVLLVEPDPIEFEEPLALAPMADWRPVPLDETPLIEFTNPAPEEVLMPALLLELTEVEPDNVPWKTLDATIDDAMGALRSRQDTTGFWCGELQGDSILESEYILLRWILGQESDLDLALIANYLRNLQQPDGGWNLFPGGPPDISGTVKGYFALKLMGDDLDAPHMRKARKLIHSLGGAEKCNSFTKFYFAALGQISYDACPTIPPEIVLLPKWFYFNLYHVSAWTRTMILPLALVTTLRPVRKLPAHLGISELYLDIEAANRLAEPLHGLPKNWRDLFLRVDQLLKRYEECPLQFLRDRAMRESERWLLEHLDHSEGLGAIFPPMVYILIVFRALGYPEDHPRVVAAHKHLRDFYIREGDTIRLQPCVSPVWDTGIALHALAATEVSQTADEAHRATDWLLSKECLEASDWRKNCPGAAPGGWFFEFQNPHYPDVDDTAMVAMALCEVGGDRAQPAVKRGVNWLLAMQNEDGGWAAFDRTKDRPILEKIPFADHNAMQDPSCPDITGRVLECLGICGMTIKDARVRRAIAFIKKTQDECGGWWGRWGVNFVYGTWQVLSGLRSVGENMEKQYIRRAALWLRSCQKEDGSWGETCRSYDDASLKGQGESTPSQTAWGAMGLMAADGKIDPEIKKAIYWLMNQQQEDGNWEEKFYTGTGFPKVFYLKYHLYRLYFPLMALGRYRKITRV